jgi:glyoxylase-like metal-dependent hydrolase (beta-lactamase superfamily II)
MTAAGFEPGCAVAVGPRVQRVVADNPGRMTGPGTNTYLVGAPDGTGPLVILDPGPASPGHVAALIDAVAGRPVHAIVVTHTHADHSPASAPLAAHFAAPRYGRRARHLEFQDPSFVAEHAVEADTVVRIAGCTLRAVLTPGHASNHVCWYLAEERALFTGDHVLGTVSPVILAPDGDMAEYLDSLERLLALELSRLLPGHGPPLEHPYAVLRALIAHRLQREAKVRAALGARPATLEALLTRVYDDVDPALHAWARYSLEAHLIKLEHDGAARRVPGDAGAWCAAAQ